jgi:glycine betaine/proline transport system ATP-binding protein
MQAVQFDDVDIIFGRNRNAALAMVRDGASREEIASRTGCVLGAAGVSLGVERGEICVLMGLSGSGKSTVLRAINRLNKVSRGAVWVEHGGARIDVGTCPDAVLRDIRLRTVATVFQQFALLPWRTVAQNVAFGLEMRGMAKPERMRIVEEKLAMVGLSAWSGKYAHELSGGMQQRVGLARAFATDADILLMDEPFSALDPLIRDKLQDELLDLQARLHKTIVFVSHDLDEAMKLGNRIAIMQGGRIVQFGTPEDILLRPADSYVAAFVKHVNPLNVLRGGAIMRPLEHLARDGNAIYLDHARGLLLELDDQGRPIRAVWNGENRAITHCATEASVAEPGDFLTAPSDMKLRAAISLKRQTPHPILLIDQLGRLAGLCGDEEIYLALLRRPD